MSILKEFKAFIIRGNVIDLAIALVIGVAFGKIISSFVNDIIMPPLSLLIGGVNLKDQKTELRAAIINPDGTILTPATP